MSVASMSTVLIGCELLATVKVIQQWTFGIDAQILQ